MKKKLCTTLAASLALALALPAFAQQDTTPPTDASPPADTSAPSTASDMGSDSSDQQAAPPAHRQHRHHGAARAPDAGASADSNSVSNSPAYNANTAAMTGNEPKVVDYQRSNRQKRYPAVDHGHVAGDPPVIDHSGDQAPVENPTHTTVNVPPSGQP